MRRFLLCLLAVTCAQASLSSVSVTVFSNGESYGGVKVKLTPDDVPSGDALAAYLSTLVPVDGLFTDESKTSTESVADRVYTGTGRLIHSFEDLTAEDRLYVVAPGLLFVWPFVELGHRVFVESTQSPTGKPIVLESFSDSPRVFHIHDFFSNDEADALIERILAIEDDDFKLKRSTVGHDSASGLTSDVRTSDNAYDSQSDISKSLMKRSFDVLGLGDFDSGLADGLQLLRYNLKQAYIPHLDWFDVDTTSTFNWDPKAGGANRFATVFLYLSNVTRGGQTVFPLAAMPEGSPHEPMPVDDDLAGFEKGTWEHKMVKQCYSKMATYPIKTHAVLFYSQKGNGELDPMAEHGGCPVIEGTKWAANLWVWNKEDTSRHADVTLDFHNPLEIAVDVFWSETKMISLAPHETFEGQISFGGTWSFRDAETGAILHKHKLDMNAGSPQLLSIPAPDAAKDEL